MKPEGQHFSVIGMSSAAGKGRESPYDFAKYIQSVSHSPSVISYSHRCTALPRVHTPQGNRFQAGLDCPFFLFCYRAE